MGKSLCLHKMQKHWTNSLKLSRQNEDQRNAMDQAFERLPKYVQHCIVLSYIVFYDVPRAPDLIVIALKAPKRFKSSYICFFMAKQPEIKDSLGDKATVTEISKRSAEMWYEYPPLIAWCLLLSLTSSIPTHNSKAQSFSRGTCTLGRCSS
jgi:hypothetical protein